MYEALHAAGIEMRTNGYYPKPPGQVPSDVAERAVSLYLAGSSVKAVVGELGLKVQHVSRLVDERGVKRSRREARRLAANGSGASPPNEWPAELAADVLKRYAAGESGVRIAESLGLAQSSVYRVLEDCDVLRSHAEASRLREGRQERSEAAGKVQAGLPAELVEQAVGRYLAGDSPRIIGRALGTSPTRVYLTLRERGVVRSRSEASRLGKARARAKGLGQAVELPAGWEAVAVERYVAGESGPAIANGLGVSRPRVYGVLRERGLIRSASQARKLDEARRRAAKGRQPRPAAPGVRRRPWPWPAELADLVVERYSAGESGEAIAP